MSQFLEELITEPIGLVIAMVILTTAIGIGLYGYWTYTNHVTLQNYLWPIAEVVPYKGNYYLGIVNTGYEPFVVKQIYLSNGSTISVNTKPLTHNQWFTETTNQLPIAVKVCSAIDPGICVVAPVHGWAMAEVGVPPDAILVVVVEGNNTQNQGGQGWLLLWESGNCPWSLTWYGWAGGSISHVGNLTFLIQPVYGEVHFIPINLLGPIEATPGSAVIFKVVCIWQSAP
jgi:CubicO group peptidase (beta-lactamase class C family)